MSLKQYIILMLVGTVLCWASWALVLIYLDPVSSGWLGFGFFYSSLYLALVGSFSLIGMGLRLVFVKQGAVFRQVAIAFRQAFFFGFLVIAALFLQSKNIFTWWSMLFLVAALTLIEFAILVLRRREPSL
ncbi:hypothetical protein A3H10_03275 [Candidatus Uhrbacteria bacterium RIFCSPLOWO2_12_FULL_46_10]|uniref:Uncharacterized protein n=1 Tax=Candidatus Uhrbacteria bacterium RIFCSPLOWO2_01_FULL_47_25 TaxID=1802402 RepID=A0A1F7UYI0_9BACT|nr:MAG: hypothetical protein UX68_C0014G0015 [Parcubacteria group bacterium GW2011_GWA2_46_9]OGL59865.1 MAG: hypothetical protein A2752_03930 [Candidatus Uhrbacteria bacterium RIFCSPHIGHO2_01_FULL_46_23]OGL76616.1 MAG: hypothetical protein A3E96_00520 [Candidatus Uhrbacteria bacterium RIFCSPHIGHO2_12_FULL_46_13]OGL82777.1 MAG: hypothetical protein A2936_05585 [Candidatus Uhrbacteria bacterium RIFCSPLOWO2_01_FULL_47_25]OGL85188.1 MAG: hypothetical protein A3I37_01535 [Candidatus Uhrbacteria bact